MASNPQTRATLQLIQTKRLVGKPRVFGSLCHRCCVLVEKFTWISPVAGCDPYRPLLNTAFEWVKPGALQSLSGLMTIAVHVLHDLVGQLSKYLAVEMGVMMMVSVMLMILLR